MPENQKALIWSHERRCYRTHIVFRLNGKRKTRRSCSEARQAGSPCVLEDGTAVRWQGRHVRAAVRKILGTPETFFTSVFSAQGKRSVIGVQECRDQDAAGRSARVDEIRVLGLKAAETAKLLKAGLTAMRHEQVGFDDESHRIETECSRLSGARSARANRCCGQAGRTTGARCGQGDADATRCGTESDTANRGPALGIACGAASADPDRTGCRPIAG